MNLGNSSAERRVVATTFFLCILIFLPGCEEFPNQPTSGPPASDFFWPLQEGNAFIYKGSDGTESESKILKIVEEDKKRIRIHTLTTHRDLTGKSSDQHVNLVFKIFKTVDRIVVSPKKISSVQSLVLSGPITKGKKWSHSATIKGPIDNENPNIFLRFKGYCEIIQTKDQKVLGKTRTCMQYSCPLEENGNSITEEGTYCKGTGRVKTKFTIQYSKRKAPPIIREVTLTQIKSPNKN